MLTVNLVKIPVSDLSVSVPFYEAALGLTADFVSEEYGWAQLGGAACAIALYVPGQGGGDRALSGTVDFHLTHDRIDALRETAAAVAEDAIIHQNADATRSLEFSDPDGNILKIMERHADED